MKLDILKETLTRAHLPLPREIGSVAGPAWGYRNRVRLHVLGNALAYRQRGSHKLLRVTHCPIAAPLIEKAIAAVERIAKRLRLRICAMRWSSLPTASRTNCSCRSGRRNRGASPNAAWKHLRERLQVEIPEVVGVGYFRSQP